MTPEHIHNQLMALSNEPVPDVEIGWARLESRLPARTPGFLTRMGSWVRRPFIISFASVTLGTGAAYAAGVEPIRNGVDWAWSQVTGSGDGRQVDPSTDRQGDDFSSRERGIGSDDDRPAALDPDADKRDADERRSHDEGDRNGGDGHTTGGIGDRDDDYRDDDRDDDDDADDRGDDAEDRDDDAEDAADDRDDDADDAADDRDDDADDAFDDDEGDASDDNEVDEPRDSGDDDDDVAPELDEDREVDDDEDID